MTNHKDLQPATITLAGACRRIGISTATATKLLETAPEDFPRAFKIGSRRYILRRELDAWFASETTKWAGLGQDGSHATHRRRPLPTN